jgi:3-hydroxyacyl-[acyl-carrier-protein] dehydratase
LFRNDLYTTGVISETESGLLVPVQINGHHPLFNGHFPGQPVFPGACMLEMIQEILELKLGRRLRTTGGPLIKFLSMIIPEKNPDILVEINYQDREGKIRSQGKIFFGETIFMKYQLEFLPEKS